MVSTFQMQSFYRPTPLTVDTTHTQQKFFDEESSSVMDDSIMDQSALNSGLEMSPALVDSRRESFAVGASLFSPKQEDWAAVDMQSIPSNSTFLDQQPHSNNPFMSAQHQPVASNFVPQQTWAPMPSSTPASAAPVTSFDSLSVDFDPAPSAGFLRSPIPFTNPTNNVTMFSAVNNHSSMPTSPHKDHWSGNMAMNKKSRPDSPGIRSHNELRKGDGIRKKNARFDIPAERNLANIDHLIAQSTDEQEVKELKQQKRLLRNRQAALDSRQRKKQHTEQLEVEKKHYTALISNLEEEIEDMRLTLQRVLAEHKQVLDERPQLLHRIHTLEMDNDELVRRNAEETGDLRRQVKCLKIHIQELEGGAGAGEPSPSSAAAGNHMSGAPHSYVGTFDTTIDALAAGNGWDNMGYTMGDFGTMDSVTMVDLKQESAAATHKLQPEAQMAVARRNDAPTQSDNNEKPTTQGGILFMLFLVGALVCSSRSTPSIPRVSEDVRAASESILQNVIKDAGVGEPLSSSFAMPSLTQASGATAWPEPSAPVASVTGLDGVVPSMLGDLSDFLTRPTAEQTKEQMFSLTPAQYDGLTSDGFLSGLSEADERATSQGRRNLADALASASQTNKAEVYTRSLLWDQIPRDVVKTFVKMVAECNQNACPADGGDGDVE